MVFFHGGFSWCFFMGVFHGVVHGGFSCSFSMVFHGVQIFTPEIYIEINHFDKKSDEIEKTIKNKNKIKKRQSDEI